MVDIALVLFEMLTQYVTTRRDVLPGIQQVGDSKLAFQPLGVDAVDLHQTIISGGAGGIHRVLALHLHDRIGKFQRNIVQVTHFLGVLLKVIGKRNGVGCCRVRLRVGADTACLADICPKWDLDDCNLSLPRH